MELCSLTRHALGKLHRKKKSVRVGGSRQGELGLPVCATQTLWVPPPTLPLLRPLCLTLVCFLLLALAPCGAPRRRRAGARRAHGCHRPALARQRRS